MPDSSLWVFKDDDEAGTFNIMLIGIWIVWIFNQWAVLLILLNFLIAIISQSYEEVLSLSKKYKYSDRVALNAERTFFMNDHK